MSSKQNLYEEEKGKDLDLNWKNDDDMPKKRIPPSLEPIKLERGKSVETRKFTERDHHDAERAVEMQTTLAHQEDSIWNCVLKNDLPSMKRMASIDPNVLRKRGAVGELPVHLTFIYQHLDMAKLMLDMQPDLIRSTYQGAQYRGENCLHIAIVNQNFDMVKLLVERDASLLTGRAKGRFFQIKQPCYFGEYPLHFAACTGNKEIFSYLVEKGAPLDLVDSNGNNLLHLMVIHQLEDMYDFVEETFRRVHEDQLPEVVKIIRRQETGRHYDCALGKQLNKMKDTPFTLCARLGYTNMFSHLLKRRQEVQWSYGPVTNILHPLDDLDIPLQPNEHGRKCAVELLIDQGHHDLLFHPELRGLLRKKWRYFGKKLFLRNFFFSLAFVLLISFTVFLNPSDDQSTEGRINLICELLVLAGCLYKFVAKIKHLRLYGFHEYFSVQGAAYWENVLSLLLGIMAIGAALVKVFDRHSEWILFFEAALVTIGWFSMSVFLMGFRFTGPFVLMMYRMVKGDMSRWLLLYPVFLFSFVLAVYTLQDANSVYTLVDIFKLSFRALFGEFDFDDFTDASKWPVLTGILLVIYVVLVSIMLLTLLIAMMSNTFERIRSNSEKEWHLEWARVVLALETGMTEAERRKFIYWTEFQNMRFVQVEEIDINFFNQAKSNAKLKDISPEDIDYELDEDPLPEDMRRLASLLEDNFYEPSVISSVGSNDY